MMMIADVLTDVKLIQRKQPDCVWTVLYYFQVCVFSVAVVSACHAMVGLYMKYMCVDPFQNEHFCSRVVFVYVLYRQLAKSNSQLQIT